MNKKSNVRILTLDVETSPLISYNWGLWDQNPGLNQVVQDWNILSYAAKFVGEDKVYYNDLSKNKDKHNDKALLQDLWKLLDEADIVVGQNSVAFDVKKIKARMLIHGMKPVSSFRQIDTMLLSKKHFNFTSNKLEYLSNTLCTKHKKRTHKKFAGFELWRECLNDNKAAWAEMKAYNIEDVLSTEELYLRLIPWESNVNFSIYANDDKFVCSCGSEKFKKYGFKYTGTGRFQRYVCLKCGSESRGKTNLLTKEKKNSLRS